MQEEEEVATGIGRRRRRPESGGGGGAVGIARDLRLSSAMETVRLDSGPNRCLTWPKPSPKQPISSWGLICAVLYS
jgi:hypothetical protein